MATCTRSCSAQAAPDPDRHGAPGVAVSAAGVGGAPCDCDSGARLVDLAVVDSAALCQQPSCATHSGTRCRTRRGPAPRRPSGSQRTTAPGMLRGMGTHQAANRSAWTDFAPAYAVAAERQWAANEPTWGTVGRPERELGLLGDVRGLDVLELGCGTAYWSAWLQGRGARPIGLDLTPRSWPPPAGCRRRTDSTSAARGRR